MKRARSQVSAFNPEKFLAAEKKKSAASNRPSLGEVVPVMFSKQRARSFIDRVAAENPHAFYLGFDSEKIRAAVELWTREAAKELEAIGVMPDPELAQILIAGVVCDPYWRRIARGKKDA